MAIGTSSACLAVAGLACLPAGRKPDKQRQRGYQHHCGKSGYVFISNLVSGFLSFFY